MKNNIIVILILIAVLFTSCFGKPKMVNKLEFKKGNNTVIVLLPESCNIHKIDVYGNDEPFIAKYYHNNEYVKQIEIIDDFELIFHTNTIYEIGVDTNRGVYLGQFRIINKTTDIDAVKEVDFKDPHIKIIKEEMKFK